MRPFKGIHGCCVLALCIGPLIGPAFAQVVTPLEEIIVTARKRDESLLKVPVIETVITAQQLERAATNNFQDLVDKIPGVLIGNQTAAFGGQLSIRGIGTVVQSASVDQSVSLNIDGLSLTQALAIKGGLLDVQQVEVLKGPQALFFGKNSPAGVISMRTADPTDELETIIRGGYEFEAKEKREEAIVSGPLSSTLGARIALSYADQEGYFRNYANPSVYNGGIPGGLAPKYPVFAPAQDYMGRLTLKWSPTDRFNARLKVNHTKNAVQGDGGGLEITNCPQGAGGYALPFIAGNDCKLNRNFYIADLDPRYLLVPNGGAPFVNFTQTFGTLELNYNVAKDLKITSVSGGYGLFSDYMINGTIAAAIPVLAAPGDFRKNDFTQEVRLTSDFTTPLNFMVGGFYERGMMQTHTKLVGNTALKLPALLQDGFVHIAVKSYSGFGQLTYAVTPQVILAGGARWTHEERERHAFGLIDLVFASPPFIGPGDSPSAVPRISSHNTSPEVTLTWLPTDDLTVFGAYKQGYKSGSFNSDGLESTDQSYKDERVTGGEVGIKSRFLDRTLSLNIAAYRYHYSDLQLASIQVTAGGQGLSLRTLNAATANVRGVEAEAAYTPSVVTGLTLHGAINWNRGRFELFDTAPCYGGQTIAAGCNGHFSPTSGLYTTQNLSGKPLEKAPDWSASVDADYERPIGNRGVVLGLGLATTYTGKYVADITYIPGNEQQAYFKTDTHVSLRGENYGWEVSLVVNNLSDKITASNCVDGNYAGGQLFPGSVSGAATTGAAGVNEIGCFPERGRELWIRFALRPAILFAKK